MIQYDNFSFASPPRTGSTWFVKACYLAGFGERQRTNAHIPPPPNWKGFTVSIVRNPCDWILSYLLSLEGGYIGIPEVDDLRDCYVPGDVIAGIEKYLKKPVNVLTKMFDAYKATTVIKLEDFPWAPLQLFESLGHGQNVFDIKNMPAQNIRYGIGHSLSLEVRKRIIRHEPDLCERYEYVI